MTDPSLRDPEANRAYYRETRKYRANPAKLQEPRVRWVADHLPREAGAAVLDLGANDGFMAEFVPEGVEYMGMELNAYTVEQAYPRARGRLILGDITTDALPFRHGGWDRILLLEVLEHVPDPVALLRRAADILAPGGCVLTTSALGRGLGHEPGNHEHLCEWNPPEYYQLHAQAGLLVMEQATARVYGERFTNCIMASRRA